MYRVLPKGRAAREIARKLGLSRQWVTKTIQAYQADGEEAAVKGKKRGMSEDASQRRRSLTCEEAQKVYKWVVGKNPRQLKLDFALWTAKGVRKLIHEKFGKELSLPTVRRYLSSWGLTPQRPKKKAIQQDDAAVKQWLETEYPAIVQRAKNEKATIFGRTRRLFNRTRIGFEVTHPAAKRRRSNTIAVPAMAPQ